MYAVISRISREIERGDMTELNMFRCFGVMKIANNDMTIALDILNFQTF